MNRPEIILKFATSLDGYIDDSSSKRLILSSKEDKKAVQKLRDSVDAILIGGSTVRQDNPKLLSSNKNLKRIVFSKKANVALDANIFNHSKENLFITCSLENKEIIAKELGNKANLIFLNNLENSIEELLEKLCKMGIKKLLVEPGETLGSILIKKGLFDKIRLAYAPFFLGDSRGAKMLTLKENKKIDLKLEKLENLEGMQVSWYVKY